jgi:hypothetical protein
MLLRETQAIKLDPDGTDWGTNIAIVHSNVPTTLPVKKRWPSEQAMQLAWQGYDVTLLDFRVAAQMGLADNVYYRVNGSPADTVVDFDLEFFSLCDRYKLSCFGTWHNAGHNIQETGINLPFSELFTDPAQDVRRDKMLVSFNNATSDRVFDNDGKPYSRGWYALGLTWHSGGFFLDREDIVLIPIKYTRFTDIGAGTPDQPDRSTFDVTIRRMVNFAPKVGEVLTYQIGSGSKVVTGELTVEKDNMVTIPNITLDSNSVHTGVLLRRKEAVVNPPTPDIIVYTSSPIDARPLNRTRMVNRSLLQSASDVAHINSGFEETNLEMKNLTTGNITMIFDCWSDTTLHCAAQEGRGSPDGTKVAYSVSYSGGVREPTNGGARKLDPITHAKIYIYDVATDTSTIVPNQGITDINRMPDWINNDTLVYSSNAAGNHLPKDSYNTHKGTYVDANGRVRTIQAGNSQPPNYYGVSQVYGYRHSSKSMQLFKMKIDGTEVVNLTPHEINAIRPTVLRQPQHKGRIMYSSWQSTEDKGYYGSTGMGTIQNLWWICSIDQNGAGGTCNLNAHNSPLLPNKEYMPPGLIGGQGKDKFLAMRSVAEDIEGNLYVTSYYRANHFGLGNIYKFSIDDFHVEGCSTADCLDNAGEGVTSMFPGSGHFVPKDLMSIAPFGVGQDVTPLIDPVTKKVFGKAGFMAPRANGNMLATYGEGYCYIPHTPSSAGEQFNIGGLPDSAWVCNRDVVEFLQPRVLDPFDETQMKRLAADPNKNEWDAIELSVHPIPYQTPPIPESDVCYLQVVDIRNAELGPSEPYNFQKYGQIVAVQGNSVKAGDGEFFKNNIYGLAIYGIEFWDVMYPNSQFGLASNYHGHKDKWLMGIQPMEADGSVKARVPCDVPFQMSGVDENGTVIAHDSILHSLRPGETRSCHGCHDGHSVERSTAIGDSAAERFKGTTADGLLVFPPLLDAKDKVSFQTEVAPVLQEMCGGCHVDQGFQNDDLLWSRVAADHMQLDWPWIERRTTINGNFRLPRPYFSPLVARFPRLAPLYWYCMGERLDGWENSSYDNDIDFASPHVAAGTAEQCKTISDWINLGASDQ